MHFPDAIDGFSSDRAAAERRWEEQFRAVPNPKSAREHLRRLTLEPHIAGTKEDYATAVYVRDQLRSYGLSADLKEYEVWLNYPNTASILELITTKRQRLSTHEAIVPGDPTSSNPKITPLFNGYSASGDVTAPVVYANYGLPGDYEELKKAGVDVKGKIVIVRYGNSFRGVKAKVAEITAQLVASSIPIRKTTVTCRATFFRKDHGVRLRRDSVVRCSIYLIIRAIR